MMPLLTRYFSFQHLLMAPLFNRALWMPSKTDGNPDN